MQLLSRNTYTGCIFVKSKLVIHERFEVQTGNQLSHLDTPSAKAYAASDFRSEHQKIFAYVCELGTIPRISKAQMFMGFTDHQVSLIASGLVSIDEQNSFRQVFICTMPDGEKLSTDYKTLFTPWPDLKVINTFIKPISLTMIQFLNKKLTHRNIRPDNIFVTADQSHITLGECFCDMAGMNQPTLVEPLEEALLPSQNRTVGTEYHDTHAIAATAIFMLTGGHPRPELSETELIEERLRYGTVNAYLNGRKVPQKVMELLRGCLSDIPEHRWGIEDLFAWANNERVRLVGHEQPKQARHAFIFSENKTCHTLNELANCIRQDQEQAIAVLSEGKVPDWLNTELQEKALAEYIDLQTKSAPLTTFTSSSAQTQKFLARIAQCIDKNGPLSWKQEMFLPESMGGAIVNAAINKQKLDKYREIIRSGIWEDYLTSSKNPKLDSYTIKTKTLQSYLSSPVCVQGIERCIYALNIDAPCLSTALDGQPAYSGKEILTILENKAKQNDKPEFPLDRHVASFLAERDKNAKLNLLKDLESEKLPKKISAQLNQLAIMQKQSGLKSLPNLCKWASGICKELINSYKNKNTRKALHSKIKDFSAEGSLIKLNQVMNNQNRIRKDMADFRANKNSWMLMNSEIKATRDKLLNNSTIPTSIGRRIAVGSACLLSLTFSAIFMIYNVLR